MYVQTRIKTEARDVREVSTARTRLDATLQSLVDKKEESNESSGESEDDNDGPVMIQVPVVRSSGSPAASPSKRANIVRARKRKRRHGTTDASDAASRYHQAAYMMKLFDRSVDLAQFGEKTPLYPIARAWMRDNNLDLLEENSQEEDEIDDKDPNNLYKMPQPLRLKSEIRGRDLRIPVPIVTEEEPLDIHKDPDLGPPPEELLLRHMARWKAVRQRWVAAARANEQRFSNSMTILKDMFEQNIQNQE